jgi:hypothetical protein
MSQFHPMMKVHFHPRMKVTSIFLFIAFGDCSRSLRTALSIHLKNWCSTAASFLWLKSASTVVTSCVVKPGQARPLSIWSVLLFEARSGPQAKRSLLKHGSN